MGGGEARRPPFLQRAPLKPLAAARRPFERSSDVCVCTWPEAAVRDFQAAGHFPPVCDLPAWRIEKLNHGRVPEKGPILISIYHRIRLQVAGTLVGKDMQALCPVEKSVSVDECSSIATMHFDPKDEFMDDKVNDTKQMDALDETLMDASEFNAVLALQALANDANAAHATAAHNLIHFHLNEKRVSVMPLVKYCSGNSIPKSAAALFKKAASLHKRTQ